MVGTPATYIVGFFPMAGGIWYRLTKDELLKDFSRGLAQYLYRYGEMLEPQTGKFIADHDTHVTHSLLANLSWALTFEDQEMAEWVKRGYDYCLSVRDPAQTGISFRQEACSVADTIGIGIMLSQAGMGDYWDTVDRLVRNTYLVTHVTSTDWTQGKPITYKKELKAGQFQPKDGAERCVGVWRQNLETIKCKWSAGCCNGNCSRMLYYVWDNILTDEGNRLCVNLPYNRASQWADVDSWLPYEGRIKVTMKTAKDHLLVRIADWVDRDRVSGVINGNQAPLTWSGNYVDVGKVEAGDKIVVEFPMKVRKINTALPIPDREQLKDDKWIMQDYQITLKGNTVIDLSPDLAYPLSKQTKYRADKAPMKKVTRFVSKERFLF
jgi:hypothetical protein